LQRTATFSNLTALERGGRAALHAQAGWRRRRKHARGGAHARRALAALRTVGLEPVAAEQAETLDGFQQRLLVHRRGAGRGPRVLLADSRPPARCADLRGSRSPPAGASGVTLVWATQRQLVRAVADRNAGDGRPSGRGWRRMPRMFARLACARSGSWCSPVAGGEKHPSATRTVTIAVDAPWPPTRASARRRESSWHRAGVRAPSGIVDFKVVTSANAGYPSRRSRKSARNRAARDRDHQRGTRSTLPGNADKAHVPSRSSTATGEPGRSDTRPNVFRIAPTNLAWRFALRGIWCRS
jgi:hypothetical protein